jgi:membrane protein implicated in regulation of membrane protease activity
MMDFFTHPAVAPFSIAALALFGLLLIEVVTLLLGKPLSALLDHAVGHDGVHLDHGHVEMGTGLDHAIDHGAKPEGHHQGAFGTALDWLNAGRVPLLVLIITLLAAFAALGMVLQTIASFISYVPSLLAVVIVIAPAVICTRHLTRFVAMVVPRDETYAQTGADFVGLVGEVTVGPVKRGVVARARIRDRHGNTHWPRVEPADPEQVIPAGASVLVIEVRKGGTLAVTPADARLTEGREQPAG